jgi:polyhydroxyalkanoate synthesis regulator phasin
MQEAFNAFVSTLVKNFNLSNDDTTEFVSQLLVSLKKNEFRNKSKENKRGPKYWRKRKFLKENEFRNVVETTTHFTSALGSLMHQLGLIETDAKLEKAVGDYVSNLATILKQSKDNLDLSLSKVLS